MNKAISNIVSNLKDINDPYAQAIAAYALQLAGHSMKDQALEDLVSKSITKGFVLKIFAIFTSQFEYIN